MTIVLEPLAGEVVRPHAFGDRYMVDARLKFSGNYTTGGDVTLKEELEKVLKQLGVGELDWVDVSGSSGGYKLDYNYATGKLQVFRTGAALKGTFEELPEEAYPAAITGATVRVMAIGK